MGAISWAIFGLLAGMVAKWLMPGRNPMGCILTSILGIGVAMVGGFIGTQIGWGTTSGWDVRSFCLAVAGAMVLLYLHRVLSGKMPG